MVHTVGGFTAEEWRTIMQGIGSIATAVIGAAGLAYARLAMKRATGARTAADDAVEAGGRAEVAVTSTTSDLTAELAALRKSVQTLTRSTAISRPRVLPAPTLDEAAESVTSRATAVPSEPTSAAAVAPEEEAPEGAGPDEGAEGASAAAEGAEQPPSLDTAAVWTVLGRRR